MKKLVLSIAAACGLLSGCIAVPVSDAGVHVSGTVRSGSAGHSYRRDRDGDGVPNRYDRRPNNPYRY
ncbi:hypothetical protein [Noviherbaspirillum saxi]|uniref:Lipoprotein n=1 Tax=Noviherbaspirillum saxi TaxID=2320863 RepID=A0A3A3FM50_9BURK|nr:hypothetical protein [Noviherbaspirillum saxi]RJF95801.1 hypothetical protein D3871_20725 [Noviherbaspirillum saxi]